MEYITLQNSDLKVSRLCMGGCPMGGYGWGHVEKQELIDAVHLALDNGVNFFDTADTYGLGESERVLGEALKNRRNEAIIATKFGVRVENGKTLYDNSPEYIEKALYASLERLQTHYIDLYQIHYRDEKTPLEIVVLKLEELKRRGLIRYYGLSNVSEENIEEILASGGKFVSFQDEYSLACRKNEEFMCKASDELGLTALTWGSLGQGILSGKYDENTTFSQDDRRAKEIYVNFHGEKLKKNLEIVKIMKVISINRKVSVPAIALRWILDNLDNSIVLVGIKSPKQLNGNLEAFGWNLSLEEFNKLNLISR